MLNALTATRWIAVSVACLAGAYILVYVLLSLFGQYRSFSWAGLAHWETYPMWAPLGSFDSHPPAGSLDAKRGGVWREWLFRFYFTLWDMDNHYVHTRHDVYKTGTISDTGKWIYTTNNSSILETRNDPK